MGASWRVIYIHLESNEEIFDQHVNEVRSSNLEQIVRTSEEHLVTPSSETISSPNN